MTDEIQVVNRTLLADTGWKIVGRMAMEPTRKHDEEEYFEQFQRIRLLGDGYQAWAGDTYLAAAADAKTDNARGDKAAEIAEAAGFERRSIRTWGYVCKNVPVTIRIVTDEYPSLTFGHLHVAASMEEADQRKWLHKAGKGAWSVAQLRAAIKADAGAWQPRAFNVWPAFLIEEWQQEYPGQIPGNILLNILHFTTKPGDLVIDPFAGGGNMALACERAGRRCVSYDIKPKFKGIKLHDAVESFPNSGAALVFLDPPYWKQKKGEYESGGADLSNKTLPEFYQAMEAVIGNSRAALADGGKCVLIVGATQDEQGFHDHALELYARVRDEWRLENHVTAAYPTSQYTGNDIKAAMAAGKMLNLYTSLLFLVKP